MIMPNPLDGFTVDRSAIRHIGHDLQRPECILAERDGTLWAADARGGVTRIAPDGSQQFVGQRADERFATSAATTADAFEAKFTQGTLPNGLAFTAEGDILISNFGTDRLELMARDGRTRTLHDRIDGLPIGKVNFVLRDRRNRIWLTVSTRVNPWTAAAARRVRDGYIAVVDEHGLRVVADARGVALHRGDHRPAHHAHAARRIGLRGSAAHRARGVRPGAPGRAARRHRLRQLRQPLVHAGDGRSADRAHAAGRQAPAARRRQWRAGPHPGAAHAGRQRHR
jgi:hypothetical protein